MFGVVGQITYVKVTFTQGRCLQVKSEDVILFWEMKVLGNTSTVKITLREGKFHMGKSKWLVSELFLRLSSRSDGIPESASWPIRVIWLSFSRSISRVGCPRRVPNRISTMRLWLKSSSLSLGSASKIERRVSACSIWLYDSRISSTLSSDSGMKLSAWIICTWLWLKSMERSSGVR